MDTEEKSTSPEVRCLDCGTALPEDQAEQASAAPCPSYGSLRRSVTLHISDRVPVYESLRGKTRRPALPSKKKTRVDFIERDVKRKSDGKRLRHSRHIGRDEDRYVETLVDPQSGEILHHCEEPLSQHRGHGSDKKGHARRADPDDSQ